MSSVEATVLLEEQTGEEGVVWSDCAVELWLSSHAAVCRSGIHWDLLSSLLCVFLPAGGL